MYILILVFHSRSFILVPSCFSATVCSRLMFSIFCFIASLAGEGGAFTTRERQRERDRETRKRETRETETEREREKKVLHYNCVHKYMYNAYTCMHFYIYNYTCTCPTWCRTLNSFWFQLCSLPFRLCWRVFTFLATSWTLREEII